MQPHMQGVQLPGLEEQVHFKVIKGFRAISSNRLGCSFRWESQHPRGPAQDDSLPFSNLQGTAQNYASPSQG